MTLNLQTSEQFQGRPRRSWGLENDVPFRVFFVRGALLFWGPKTGALMWKTTH